ncbi:MAG: hypothetical protein SFU98_19385 [Leptospiraceae bacterium]|nr:hypothetical protein [Leptospiraceae bacterium]
MQRLKQLIEIYKQNNSVPTLKEILKDFPDLSERTVKQINYLAKMRIKGIQDLTDTLVDASKEEVDSAIMSLWFELRSEWMRYNAVNNYNMVMHGKADDMSVILSAFISNLIVQLEAMLEKEQIEEMHNIMVKVQYSHA